MHDRRLRMLTPFAVLLAAIVAGACATTSTPLERSMPTIAEASAALERCCGDSAMGVGLRIAIDYREPGITTRRFTHEQFWNAVLPVVSYAGFRVEEIGQSLHGRVIRSVTIGNGPTRVLLWSQMHGDESTATMALADIFRWFANTRAEDRDDALRDRLTRELTLVFVPMLNPDGAEQFQRENAAGVDINRDARRLATPEARTLKTVRDQLKPEFGFNLHDQNARTRAGRDGEQAAIALLAPPFNEARAYNSVRERARLVASTLATSFLTELPGRVAKYDDGFNPRAFGDLMQQWGTSTVLIESGALPTDPQKQRLRALHVAALLSVFDALATGAYRGANPATYESLPYNASGASDLLITGAQLVLPGVAPMLVDLAINYDDAVARTGARVREVGDLSAVIAIDTLDASGLFVHPETSMLARTAAGVSLSIGAPAVLFLRRGPDATSALVRTIGTLDSARN